MKKLKVVTIGGGSSYTPELVEGFILRYDSLPITELWLVDIEEGKEKLEIVGKLAQRMVEKAGLPIKVILSLDRREALKDADFVTTQMRVGQIDARILDERIPISHGMIGQETNGAGGMFKAFRTIPVILDIVKDIQELCPDAWMINFTNPAGMVTEAITRYTDFKRTIGLCNVPVDMKFHFAKILDVDYDALTLQLSGLNHHVFITDILHNNTSVFDTVIENYIQKGSETLEMKNFSTLAYTPEFIKGLNAIPCPYHNYYYFTQEQLAKNIEEFNNGTVRGEVVQKLETELFEQYKDVNLAVKPKQLELRGGAHYSDAACSLIDSIYNDRQDIQYVNTLNNGAISNLPSDTVIEVAATITKDGPVPIPVGTLRPAINGTVQNIKAFELMTIEAAITGNTDLAITALSSNPLCPSSYKAREVVLEMLDAHKAYLPQFFK